MNRLKNRVTGFAMHAQSSFNLSKWWERRSYRKIFIPLAALRRPVALRRHSFVTWSLFDAWASSPPFTTPDRPFGAPAINGATDALPDSSRFHFPFSSALFIKQVLSMVKCPVFYNVHRSLFSFPDSASFRALINSPSGDFQPMPSNCCSMRETLLSSAASFADLLRKIEFETHEDGE